MCNHSLVLGPDSGSRQPWVNLLLKKKLTQCFHLYFIVRFLEHSFTSWLAVISKSMLIF